MDGRAHVAGRDAAFVEQGVDTLLDAVGRIFGRGEDLADLKDAGTLVHEDEVGERSPDVYAKPRRHEGKFTIHGAVILSAIARRAIVPAQNEKGSVAAELYPTTVNVGCSLAV